MHRCASFCPSFLVECSGGHRDNNVLSTKELHRLDLLLCCLCPYWCPNHVDDLKWRRCKFSRSSDLRVHNLPWPHDSASWSEQRKSPDCHVPYHGRRARREPLLSLLEIAQCRIPSYLRDYCADQESYCSWSCTEQWLPRKPRLSIIEPKSLVSSLKSKRFWNPHAQFSLSFFLFMVVLQ